MNLFSSRIDFSQPQENDIITFDPHKDYKTAIHESDLFRENEIIHKNGSQKSSPNENRSHAKQTYFKNHFTVKKEPIFIREPKKYHGNLIIKPEIGIWMQHKDDPDLFHKRRILGNHFS